MIVYVKEEKIIERDFIGKKIVKKLFQEFLFVIFMLFAIITLSLSYLIGGKDLKSKWKQNLLAYAVKLNSIFFR